MSVSAIYTITHESGKTYVGSAVNVLNRRAVHLSRLRAGKHTNPHLQSAWNKYGEAAFRFAIIEECEPEELIEREQWWLDRIPLAYNIRVEARSNLGVKPTTRARARMSVAKMGNKNRLGKKHTPEARAKMLGNKNALGYKHTTEACAKISKTHTGKKLTPEHRAKISATLRARLDMEKIL